jgi:hypothetical protein
METLQSPEVYYLLNVDMMMIVVEKESAVAVPLACTTRNRAGSLFLFLFCHCIVHILVRSIPAFKAQEY